MWKRRENDKNENKSIRLRTIPQENGEKIGMGPKRL
jgi:hypothetical protein